MERIVYGDLLRWKNDKDRMPLLLEGVRQCGKTYILKEFGAREYDDVAYFTLVRNPSVQDIFLTDLDPKRIIDELGAVRGKKIEPGKTLVILDEIQFCGQALTSLKYFCEDAPEYHIACAGSLLGVMKVEPHSFPVGKVSIIKMYPMSFKEFLLANSEDMLVGYVEENYPEKKIPLPLMDKLNSYLDQYFVVGGMPAAVSSWVKDRDIEKVDALLDWIIMTYENDFSRHASESLSKLTFIWDSVPMQLAKDNKKFVFGHAKTGMRSKDLEDALRWLVNAGLVYTVKRISRPEMPLAMFADGTHFKLYLADIGILRKRSGVPPEFVFSRDKRYETYRGAATENYILSELIAGKGGIPYYWRSDGKAEVDFVAQFGHDAVPIEAKAGSNKSRSLSEFINRYDPNVAVVTAPRENKSEVVTYVPLCVFWKVRDVISKRTQRAGGIPDRSGRGHS